MKNILIRVGGWRAQLTGERLSAVLANKHWLIYLAGLLDGLLVAAIAAGILL